MKEADMSSSLNDGHSDGLPPGHPAGTDPPISAGAVLSGRGQRAGGGLLGPTARSRGGGVPRSSPNVAAESPGGGGSPTVLIAVEDEEDSVRTLRVAHQLFGDSAEYLAINVGEGRYTSMQWAYVYPVAFPGTWHPSARTADQPSHVGSAEAVADSVADAAGMPSVTGLGNVGDPATAILEAAHDNGVDVVVIGAHERGWFSRLFSGSVEQDLMRTGDFSVLVVK